MFSAIWDGLRCCHGPSIAARKRHGLPVPSASLRAGGMTEFRKTQRQRGWRNSLLLTQLRRLVGECFLDFFDHFADLWGQGALRFDAKIFLIFVEGARRIAQLESDIGEEYVRGGEIG